MNSKAPNTGMYILAMGVVSSLAAAGLAQDKLSAPSSVRSSAASETSSRALLGSVAFTEPYRVIELAPSEIGRISKLNVRRGSQVKAGDLLCELDVSALQARRKTAEQISLSTARREALEIEYQRKQARLETFEILARSGGGTPEELAEAEADARIAELNVQAADEELRRGKLEVAEIDAQIEQRRIRAGIDGVVIEVHREAGEYVSASDPKVATLVSLDRLRASFFLPAESVAEVHAGEETVLRFVLSGQEATCTIDYVGPLTNADSGRVRVDVIVNNFDRKLRSGLQCTLPKLVAKSTKYAEGTQTGKSQISR